MPLSFLSSHAFLHRSCLSLFSLHIFSSQSSSLLCLRPLSTPSLIFPHFPWAVGVVRLHSCSSLAAWTQYRVGHHLSLTFLHQHLLSLFPSHYDPPHRSLASLLFLYSYFQYLPHHALSPYYFLGSFPLLSYPSPPYLYSPLPFRLLPALSLPVDDGYSLELHLFLLFLLHSSDPHRQLLGSPESRLSHLRHWQNQNYFALLQDQLLCSRPPLHHHCLT